MDSKINQIEPKEIEKVPYQSESQNLPTINYQNDYNNSLSTDYVQLKKKQEEEDYVKNMIQEEWKHTLSAQNEEYQLQQKHNTIDYNQQEEIKYNSNHTSKTMPIQCSYSQQYQGAPFQYDQPTIINNISQNDTKPLQTQSNSFQGVKRLENEHIQIKTSVTQPIQQQENYQNSQTLKKINIVEYYKKVLSDIFYFSDKQKYDICIQMLNKLKLSKKPDNGIYKDLDKKEYQVDGQMDFYQFLQTQASQQEIDTVDDVQFMEKEIKFMDSTIGDNKDWNQEKFENNTQIKKIKKAEKVVNLKFGLPIISDREAFLDGMGVDRLEENGSILIFTKSIQENNHFLKKHNIQLPKSKNVAVDIQFFYCEIIPIDRNNCKWTALCNIDPKVNFLPQRVINFFIRKIGTYMMQKLLNIAKDIKGTQWEKNTKLPENIEFYQWINERVETFFKSKGL